MITLNAPGARTLADARQWFIDGEGVYVTQSEGQAELHIRGMIVDTRPVAEINMGEAQAWAIEWLAAESDAMNADAARQLAETIAHQHENEIDEAVAQVRAQADEDAYGRYVSDGMADTDGHYVPLDRAAWSYGR